MTETRISEKRLRLGKITTDFATVASHQLRTPISIIRWSLDLLRSGKLGALNSRQNEFVQQAYDQNLFMARIIGDLLKISRLESGLLTIHPEKVDFVKIVKDIVRKNKTLGRAYNCSISLSMKGNIGPLTTDRIKIKDIISALLDNAIRYSHGKNKVSIAIWKSGKHLLFRISDKGIGISPSQADHIFTKFFRASSAMKLQTQGLGLQLYIAKHIIEALGGKIWFSSKYFLGTTFFISLPFHFVHKKLVTYEEPASRFTEDILEYFYNHIDDGIVILEATQKIIKMNVVAQKIFGRAREHLVGSKITKIFNDPQLKKAFKELEEKSQDKVSFHYEDVVGSDVYNYRVSVFPIVYYATLEGWVIILHNLKTKSQFELLENDALKKEREMVSITVHELKNPLGSAKWGLELLQNEKVGKLNQRQRELVEELYRGNQRLLVLVSDLLNLSKIEEGKFEIIPRAVNIQSILSEVLSGFRQGIKDKRLKLKIFRQSSNAKVLADRIRISQVVANLLSNAIKYTTPKRDISVGMKIVSAEWLKNVKVPTFHKIHFLHHRQGYLLIWVRDRGIGIPRSQQKKIFTKFFRGKQILESKIEGTGLGLYITKSIVHLHKGDIWFESKENEGSTFYFTLPLA